jgi:hypothetical protein
LRGDPPLTRTLALIHHRNKPDDLAFRIVCDALMELANIPQRESTSTNRCYSDKGGDVLNAISLHSPVSSPTSP